MAAKQKVIKVGSRVQAKTIRATEFQPGVVTEVREGSTGTWYSVKLKGGTVINTRASSIK